MTNPAPPVHTAAEAFAAGHQPAANVSHSKPGAATATTKPQNRTMPAEIVAAPIAIGAATVSSLGGTGALLGALVLAGGSALILLGTRRGRTARLR